MDDLISRAWVLAKYDRQHQGPPGGARKIIEDATTIDAIPVEWLREKIKEHTDEEGWQDYLANSFGLCIEEWQKEQEAQDG